VLRNRSRLWVCKLWRR